MSSKSIKGRSRLARSSHRPSASHKQAVVAGSSSSFPLGSPSAFCCASRGASQPVIAVEKKTLRKRECSIKSVLVGCEGIEQKCRNGRVFGGVVSARSGLENTSRQRMQDIPFDRNAWRIVIRHNVVKQNRNVRNPRENEPGFVK